MSEFTGSLDAAGLLRLHELLDQLEDTSNLTAPEQQPELSRLARLAAEDLSDLAMMHQAVVEHSTELENELSQRGETIAALIEKMRRYLPEQLYARIVGGTLQATTGNQHRRHLTVFFSDIVSFTDLTDSIEPEALSQALNGYLNAMAQICDRWGGVVDKFIGDAVMIFFGDDDDADAADCARRCVQMALEMQAALPKIQQLWTRLGISEQIRIRIGINSGYATVGNFGSDRRMDYTVIGGTVNVASRLEHLCPPGAVVISGSCYSHVRELVDVESLGQIQVKGVAHPVDTLVITGVRDQISSPQRSLLIPLSGGFELPGLRFDPHNTPAVQKQLMRRSLQQALDFLNDSAGPPVDPESRTRDELS